MRILVGIGLLLFIISCNDDDIPLPVPIYLPGPMEFGYVEMEKNGQYMKASGLGYNAKVLVDSNLVGATFFTYDEFGNIRENGGFGFFPFKAGQYVMPYDEYSKIEYQGYITMYDHSTLEDRYDMNAEFHNVVTITKVDTLEDVLQGTYTTFLETVGGAIVTTVDACQGLWDGEATISITNPYNENIDITFDFSPCSECPLFPIIENATANPIEFTLTELLGSQEYTFYVITDSCVTTVNFEVGEEIFAKEYVRFEEESEDLYFCIYDLVCGLNPYKSDFRTVRLNN